MAGMNFKVIDPFHHYNDEVDHQTAFGAELKRQQGVPDYLIPDAVEDRRAKKLADDQAYLDRRRQMASEYKDRRDDLITNPNALTQPSQPMSVQMPEEGRTGRKMGGAFSAFDPNAQPRPEGFTQAPSPALSGMPEEQGYLAAAGDVFMNAPTEITKGLGRGGASGLADAGDFIDSFSPTQEGYQQSAAQARSLIEQMAEAKKAGSARSSEYIREAFRFGMLNLPSNFKGAFAKAAGMIQNGKSPQEAMAIILEDEGIKDSINGVRGLSKGFADLMRDVAGSKTLEAREGWKDGLVAQGSEMVGQFGSMALPALAGGPLGLIGAAGMGAAQMGGGAYNEAIADGATVDQARSYRNWSALIGTTEALPLGRLLRFPDTSAMLDKLIDMVPEKMKSDLLSEAAGIMEQAGVEGVQEWVSGRAQNLAKQQIYDPDQEVLEGGLSDFVGGAALGGGLRATGGALKAAKDQREGKPEAGPTESGALTDPKKPQGGIDGEIMPDGTDVVPSNTAGALEGQIIDGEVNRKQIGATDKAIDAELDKQLKFEDEFEVLKDGVTNLSSPTAPKRIEKAADLKAIASDIKPAPTDAEKKSGDYPKANVKVAGLPVTLENAKGSIRSGKDKDGETWETKMPEAYGDIDGTVGADGDPIDIYVAEKNPKSKKAFVVDQIDPETGKFDEHKVIAGVDTQAEAEAIYKGGFSDGSGDKRMGAITETPTKELAKWAKGPDTAKPFASPEIEGQGAREEVQPTNVPETKQDAPAALKSYPIADRGEWYGNANYKDTGGRIEEMSPDEFLKQVRPLEIDEASRDNIDDLKNHMQSGRTLDPLSIDAKGKEDGRHRAIAAKELGIDKVPVLRWGDSKPVAKGPYETKVRRNNPNLTSIDKGYTEISQGGKPRVALWREENDGEWMMIPLDENGKEKPSKAAPSRGVMGFGPDRTATFTKADALKKLESGELDDQIAELHGETGETDGPEREATPDQPVDVAGVRSGAGQPRGNRTVRDKKRAPVPETSSVQGETEAAGGSVRKRPETVFEFIRELNRREKAGEPTDDLYQLASTHPKAGEARSRNLRSGRNRLRKFAEAAGKKLKLRHWSKKPLDVIDPKAGGSSRMRGPERDRASNPDYVPRSYYGIGVGREGGYKKESGLGDVAHEIDVDPATLYDADRDPEGLNKGEGGTLYEKAIRDAGYAGYFGTEGPLGAVAAVFEEGYPDRLVDAGGKEIPDRIKGLPAEAGGIAIKTNRRVAAVSKKYMKKAGLEAATDITEYSPVDQKRAARIADAFDKMEHAPDDPEVKASYEALATEVLAQYQAMLDNGFTVTMMDGTDPYGNQPRLAIEDVRNNNHMWVYPTDEGFGSPDLDVSDHPLLASTKYKDSKGKPMLVNDVFRAVHDYFGHAEFGNGMRASGEDHAWRNHARMFSPLARRAMTTETRGQNSWVNFGPHGEHNRKAMAEDTIYAVQKIGLLPEWVSNEGLHDKAYLVKSKNRVEQLKKDREFKIDQLSELGTKDPVNTPAVKKIDAEMASLQDVIASDATNEAGVEMYQTSRDNTIAGGLAGKNEIGVSDIEGATIIPMFADLTDSGRKFDALDGVPVVPTRLYGGPNFVNLKEYQDAGIVWAFNSKSVITGLRNKVRGLKAGGAKRVVVTMLAMKDDAHLSNSMTTLALLRTFSGLVESGRLPKKRLKEAHSFFKSKSAKRDEGYAALADMPSFKDIEKLTKWVDGATFTTRKAISKEMQSAQFRELIGDAVSLRVARELLDPEYRATQQGDALLAFEIDPDADGLIVDFDGPEAKAAGIPRHPSYRFGMRGKLVGSFGTHIPMKILYKDLLDKITKRAKAGSNPKFLMERLRAEDAQVVTPEISKQAKMVEGMHDYRVAQAYSSALAGEWRSSWDAANKGGLNPAEFETALLENIASPTLTHYTRDDVSKGRKDGTFKVFQLGSESVKSGGLSTWIGVKKKYDYSSEYDHPNIKKLFDDGVLTKDEVALVGVANNELGVKGMATFQVLKGVEEGVTVLDAFKVKSKEKPFGLLPTIYATMGFKEVGSIPFDSSYYNANQLADMEAVWSDQGWQKGDPYPDVAIMKFEGDEGVRRNATARFISEGFDALGRGSDERIGEYEASERLFQDGATDGDGSGGVRGQGDGRPDIGSLQDRAGSISRRGQDFVKSVLAADQSVLDALKIPADRLEKIRKAFPDIAASKKSSKGTVDESAADVLYRDKDSQKPVTDSDFQFDTLLKAILDGEAMAARDGVVRLTKKARKDWEKIEKLFDKVAPNVKRSLAEELTATNGAKINAKYNTASGRITIAQYALGKQTAGHEILHALRGQGYLTNEEYQALADHVVESGLLDEYDITGRYADLYTANFGSRAGEYMIEEAVAEFIGDVIAERSTVKGRVKAVIDRLAKLLQRLTGGLNDMGYTKAEDVVERILSGEVGNRIPVIERAEADILYQTARNIADPLGDFDVDNSKLNRMRELQRRMQDAFLPVKLIQRVVEQVYAGGAPLPDSLNAYEIEALGKAKIAEKSDQLVDKVEEIMTELGEKGISREDFDEFLQMRHAEERNAYIATINTKFPDGGSGITNKQAQTYLRRRKADGNYDTYMEVAKKVYAMSNAALKQRLDSGLIDQDYYDELRNGYKFYVPLKGHEAIDDSKPVKGASKGLGAKGSGLMKALGRKSRAKDVIENVIADSRSAIHSGERNKVMVALYEMVDAYGTEFTNNAGNKVKGIEGFMEMDPKKFVRVLKRAKGIGQGRKHWVPAEYVGDSAKINQYLADVAANPELKNLASEKKQHDPSLKDDELPVMIDGKRKIIKVTNDSLKEALLDATRTTDSLTGLRQFNSIFSRMLTMYNPSFAPVNFTRDVGGAGLTVGAEYGAKAAAKVMKDAFRSLEAVRAVEFNGKGKLADPELVKLYKQMKEDGGITGFSKMVRDVDSIKSELDAIQGAASGNKIDIVRKKLRAADDVVARMNAVLENATRLAAYKMQLDRGESRQKAAMYAKNISVDFNKKGTQSFLSSFYIFANPAIQGNFRMAKALVKGKNGARVAGGMVAGGFLYAMAHMLLGEGEEDEENGWFAMSDADKAFYLVIGGYKIPKPHGFSFLWNMGERMAEMTMAQINPEKYNPIKKSTGTMLADGVLGTLLAARQAFVPIGQNEDLLMAIIPSAGAPVYGAYVGKNSFGAPLYQDYASHLPNYGKYGDGTPEVYHALAKGLNDMSGGDVNTGGYVNMSPEQLEFLWNSYIAGGAGFVRKSVGFFSALGDENAKPISNEDIPIVRRFLKTERSYSHAERYWEFNARMSRVETALREAKKGDQEQYDWFLSREDEHALMGPWKAAKKRRSAVRKKLRALDTDRREGEQIGLKREILLNQRMLIEKDFVRTYQTQIDLAQAMKEPASPERARKISEIKRTQAVMKSNIQKMLADQIALEKAPRIDKARVKDMRRALVDG